MYDAIGICLRCDKPILKWTDSVSDRCGYKTGYSHEACVPNVAPTPEEFDSFNFSSLQTAAFSATPPAAAETEIPSVPPQSCGTSSSDSNNSVSSSSSTSTSSDSPPAKKTRTRGLFY